MVKNQAVELRLCAFLQEYAASDDLYWVPITRLKKDMPVVAYDLDAIYRDNEISLLEKVFRQCDIMIVSTFQMDSREYFEKDEISALLYEKDKDGFNFPWTEYSGGVEHPDRFMLNTLTGEIEQAFRRN